MFSTREGCRVRSLGSSEVWGGISGATGQPAPEMGFLLFNEEEGPRRSALFTYVPDPTGFPLFIKEEDLTGVSPAPGT